MTALAGADPYTAVLGALSQPAAASIQPPDPHGTAELLVDGKRRRTQYLSKRQDTLVPTWKATFRDVPLNVAQIRVSLEDRDLGQDDPMGTVHIVSSDLDAALKTGKVHQVKVADQSNSQILFIGISVSAKR